MAYTSITINNGMSSSQLESAILEIQYNIDLAISKNDKNKEEGYKSLLLKAQQYMIEAKERESRASSGGGGNTGGNNAPESSAGQQMPGYNPSQPMMQTPFGQAISGSPEEIKRNRASMEKAYGMLSPTEEKIKAGLEYMQSRGFNQPQFQPNPAFQQGNQDMMRPPIRSNFRPPQQPGMAQRPISWEERNRLLGITPPGQPTPMPGLPTMNKPPIRRAPRPGEPGYVPGMMYGF